MIQGRLAALCCGLALCSAVWAGPIDGKGRHIGVGGLSQPETPAERAFRAGVQAQMQRDLGKAQDQFAQAHRLDPNYAPALLGMAGIAQARNDTKQAQIFLQKAEAVAPTSAEVHLGWGRFFLASRQATEAEAAFTKARTLSPQAIAPHLELGDLYLTRTARSAEAMASFSAALAIDDKNVQAQMGLGAAAAQSGDVKLAQASFMRAAKLVPKDPVPLRSLGRLQLEQGDVDAALASFDSGLLRRPGFVPLMVDRAHALNRKSRPAEAVAQLQAAEKLAPNAAEIQLLLGDVHQGAGQWGPAESRYRKAMTLAPDHPAAYNNLAWMTISRGGDANQAVAWASKAVALSPSSSPFHDTLGWAQRSAGQLALAASSLNKAIELEPRVAGYHRHLATVQAEQQEIAAARASLTRSLELQPSGAEADQARRQLAALPPPA